MLLVASVVFGSIDDVPAPLASSSAAIPAIVVKSFGSVPATFSNHLNDNTLASALATWLSKQPLRPSLSSTPFISSTPSSTAATSISSTPKPSRADIAKLFQNPSSLSSQPSSDTSYPILPLGLLTCPHITSHRHLHHNSPSNLRNSAHIHIRSSCPATCAHRSSLLGPHVLLHSLVLCQFREGAGQGGPGGTPIPASPQTAPYSHEASPGDMALQVPMQPMQWSGYYVSTSFFCQLRSQCDASIWIHIINYNIRLNRLPPYPPHRPHFPPPTHLALTRTPVTLFLVEALPRLSSRVRMAWR
ncbi:hypothetical protein EDB19DRAFT_352939 [Suillus lakei]|nr:hypothetical protein EDB19DRAFT_352939 [Suillus lakei]